MAELVRLSRAARVLPDLRYFVAHTADVSLRSAQFAAILQELGVRTASPDEWIYRERTEGTETWPQVGYDAEFPSEGTVAEWSARLESAARSAGARRVNTDIGEWRGAGVLRSTADNLAALGTGLRAAWWTSNVLALGLLAVGAWLWLRRG